jgi:hypothetical protein
MSNAVAQLFEHSSRETPAGKADPYLLLLRTMDVHTPDVANVVRLIGDARNFAKNADPRIAPLLMDDVRTFVEALTSLTSVHGKGLKFLTTTMQKFSIQESGSPNPKMGMREMIEGKKQQKPMGYEVRDD